MLQVRSEHLCVFLQQIFDNVTEDLSNTDPGDHLGLELGGGRVDAAALLQARPRPPPSLDAYPEHARARAGFVERSRER